MEQLARCKRMAVRESNIVNLLLFMAKVYMSVHSRSLAVLPSNDGLPHGSLISSSLWFTVHAMKSPYKYHYPTGKKHMQPVVILC